MKKKRQHRKIDLLGKKGANRVRYIIKNIDLKIDKLNNASKDTAKPNGSKILFHTSKHKTNIRLNSENYNVKGFTYKFILSSNKANNQVNNYIPKPPIKKPSPEKPESKPERPAEEKK